MLDQGLGSWTARRQMSPDRVRGRVWGRRVDLRLSSRCRPGRGGRAAV